MIWYHTQSHFPDTEPTSPNAIQIATHTWLVSHKQLFINHCFDWTRVWTWAGESPSLPKTRKGWSTHLDIPSRQFMKVINRFCFYQIRDITPLISHVYYVNLPHPSSTALHLYTENSSGLESSLAGGDLGFGVSQLVTFRSEAISPQTNENLTHSCGWQLSVNR